MEVEKLEESGADPATLAERRHVLAAIERLQESNPMLGLRGVRLGIHMAALTRMQVRAIFRATASVRERTGEAPHLEIMIPLVAYASELEQARELVLRVAAEEGFEPGGGFIVGTMIELPRAALTARRIAEEADFFSFGTNDLTQTTWGFSRDDVEGAFFADYLENGVLTISPFETLDADGVGALVTTAVAGGRATKPTLHMGVCGEHGGDPESIHFFHDAGLDYVSCSPFRVPIARFAAARAVMDAQGS